MSTQTHLAAIYPSQASGTISIIPQPTTNPSQTELLISVSSIALNPVDIYQRDHGFPPMPSFPYIGGMDISGTVLSSTHPLFPIGTRVAAFATSFYSHGKLTYGAFQEKVLVPVSNAVPLPSHITFNQGALLPSAIATVFAGFYSIGLPIPHTPSPDTAQGILIWGGASSMGSISIQVLKSLGYTTFVTASPKHHAYLSTLGADYLFNYTSPSVISDIISVAHSHDIPINVGYHAAGKDTPSITSSVRILSALKSKNETAKLAVAPLVPEDLEHVEGVEVRFAKPPADEEERTMYFERIYNVWLKEKLEKGEFVPCPGMKVVEGKGLEGISKGLDILREGVSGVKVVVEVF